MSVFLGSGRHGVHTEFWFRNLLGNDHLENREGDGKIIKLNHGEICGKDWRWRDLELALVY
jgi:hypothetical protein